MNTEEVIKSYIGRKIIVDTNLFLLLVIGRYDKYLIQNHNKTSRYEIRDYNFVNNIVSRSKEIYTTPGIISELTNHLKSSDRNFEYYFQKLIRLLEILTEIHVGKNKILALPYFKNLGYTDSTIINLSKQEKCLVLTDDRNMVSELRKYNIDVLYLTEIKQEYFYSKLKL